MCDYTYSKYELCYTIEPVISEAKKLVSEGKKVAVFLDMDRTVTKGIISDPNYELTSDDIRDGVADGIEELIEKGCLVSILTARGNGVKIEAEGNNLLHRYPTDLARVLGPSWKNHKAFNFEEDFISKTLVTNESFYVTYDSRPGHGSFIYGGGKQEKGCEYGVKGAVIVSLIKEKALKFDPDVVLFADNAGFNIYETRLTLEKYEIPSTIYHVPCTPGTQRDRPNPTLPRHHSDDIVFDCWEDLAKSKGQ